MTVIDLLQIGFILLALYGVGRLGEHADDSWPWYAYSLVMFVPVLNVYIIARIARFDRRAALLLTASIAVPMIAAYGLQPGFDALMAESADLSPTKAPADTDSMYFGMAVSTIQSTLSWGRILLGLIGYGMLGLLFYHLAVVHDRNWLITLILWGTVQPALPLLYVSWPYAYTVTNDQ